MAELSTPSTTIQHGDHLTAPPAPGPALAPTPEWDPLTLSFGLASSHAAPYADVHPEAYPHPPDYPDVGPEAAGYANLLRAYHHRPVSPTRHPSHLDGRSEALASHNAPMDDVADVIGGASPTATSPPAPVPPPVPPVRLPDQHAASHAASPPVTTAMRIAGHDGALGNGAEDDMVEGDDADADGMVYAFPFYDNQPPNPVGPAPDPVLPLPLPVLPLLGLPATFGVGRPPRTIHQTADHGLAIQAIHAVLVPDATPGAMLLLSTDTVAKAAGIVDHLNAWAADAGLRAANGRRKKFSAGVIRGLLRDAFRRDEGQINICAHPDCRRISTQPNCGLANPFGTAPHYDRTASRTTAIFGVRYR